MVSKEYFNYIDLNCLSHICRNTFSNIIYEHYDNIIKIFNVNKALQYSVNKVLIEDDYLILDLIVYFKKMNINKNYYNTYFKYIFEEWNGFKKSRTNILKYLDYVNSSNTKSYFNYKKVNMDTRFSNIGTQILFCNNKSQISNNYKDNKGLINNPIIAIEFINSHNQIVYFKDISEDMYDFDIDENFKVFCAAIKRHDTVFKTFIKKYSNHNLSYDQILELVKIKPRIYKDLKLYKNDKQVIQEVIKRTKYAYKYITNIANSKILNIILDINLDEVNNNYVYFALYILCIINNTLGKHNHYNNILDKFLPHKVFRECYAILEPYINEKYILFSIDNINNNNIVKYDRNISWKNYSLLEDINYNNMNKDTEIIFKQIISEYNIKFKVNITKINITILQKIFYNLIKDNVVYPYTNYYSGLAIKSFNNLNDSLQKLFNSLIYYNFDNNPIFINTLLDILKSEFLPELSKLEYTEKCIMTKLS
jgi:hypothetical protein